MLEKDKLSFTVDADDVDIEESIMDGKKRVTLSGVHISGIYFFVKAVSKLGEEYKSKLRGYVYELVGSYAVEIFWKRVWSKRERNRYQDELEGKGNFQIIKEVNERMASDKGANPNYLVAVRYELERRNIDYSAIDNWRNINCWTRVAFYDLNGKKSIRPVTVYSQKRN